MTDKLHLWSNLLWVNKAFGPIAYCPEHRIELEVATSWGHKTQSIASGYNNGVHNFVCPIDEKTYPIFMNDIALMQRRFLSTLESLSLKDAEIVSIDGYQIPIAKSLPSEKDGEYWVEARINDTKKGKQLVVYAGKRGEKDKSQIFIDTENDKISFDQNNIHPSDVFVRLTGDFKSGKKVTLEDNSGAK